MTGWQSELTAFRFAVEYGATVMPLITPVAQTLVRLGERGGPGTRLRLVTNTGAVLTRSVADGLRRVFPGVRLVPMYGMTECKRISIARPDADLELPGTVGTALDATRAEVLGEDGKPVPAGETGQIVVRGPHLMDGYWRDPKGPGAASESRTHRSSLSLGIRVPCAALLRINEVSQDGNGLRPRGTVAQRSSSPTSGVGDSELRWPPDGPDDVRALRAAGVLVGTCGRQRGLSLWGLPVGPVSDAVRSAGFTFGAAGSLSFDMTPPSDRPAIRRVHDRRHPAGALKSSSAARGAGTVSFPWLCQLLSSRRRSASGEPAGAV